MFYGSGTMAIPYDLHLNGYQGHIDNFEVIREKTIKNTQKYMQCTLDCIDFAGE